MNRSLSLNRVSIRAAIEVPNSSIGIELMSVVKSSIDFFHTVRRNLSSSSVVDEFGNQRAVDLEGSGEPGWDANPFVNRCPHSNRIRIEALPWHELRVQRLNGLGMLNSCLKHGRLLGGWRRCRSRFCLRGTVLSLRRCNRDDCTHRAD